MECVPSFLVLLSLSYLKPEICLCLTQSRMWKINEETFHHPLGGTVYFEYCGWERQHTEWVPQITEEAEPFLGYSHLGLLPSQGARSFIPTVCSSLDCRDPLYPVLIGGFSTEVTTISSIVRANHKESDTTEQLNWAELKGKSYLPSCETHIPDDISWSSDPLEPGI